MEEPKKIKNPIKFQKIIINITKIEPKKRDYINYMYIILHQTTLQETDIDKVKAYKHLNPLYLLLQLKNT